MTGAQEGALTLCGEDTWPTPEGIDDRRARLGHAVAVLPEPVANARRHR